MDRALFPAELGARRGVAGQETDRPFQAAHEMCLKPRIAPHFSPMTQRGVEYSAFAVVLAPRHREVFILALDVLVVQVNRTIVDAQDDMQALPAVGIAELVDFVGDKR